MSRVDFIQTNLASLSLILRPGGREGKNEAKSEKRSSSMKIEKSFQPEKKSTLNEALRPEIERLKEQMRKNQKKEKVMSALLAEGKITRTEKELKEPAKEQQPEQPSELVTIDVSGHARDQEGNLLFIKNRKTDLLINKKKDEEIQIKSLLKKQRVKFSQKLERAFFDRNLVVGSNKRRARRSMLGLQFLEKGSYQPSQHRAEVRNDADNLMDVFQEGGNQGSQEQQMRVIKKRRKVNLQFNREVPEVEWWDQELLGGKHYLESLSVNEETETAGKLAAVHNGSWLNLLNFDSMGGDCQYQKVGTSDTNSRIILPMFLTKDERKKLKRKKKHEKLLQKNDKIKLGLIEPDKPKLRVGNMAIVMKNEFILDPSRIEGEARRQTDERVNKHLEANSSRKLSKGQKKDRAIRKLKRDSAKECRRAVFRISKLTEPTQLFKVNMNAKQLALNGFVIKPSNELSQFPTMVLVEGGSKAVKFYKNLMLRRIQWSQGQTSNSCQLIWEGQIESSSAGKWRMHEVADEVGGIRLLTEKKLQNFWDYMGTE